MTVMDNPTSVDAELLERLDRLSLQMTAMHEEMQRSREERARLLEITQLAGPVMDMVTARMTELEQKGYFTFATGGLGIVDKVVTSFDEDDIEALGDNIVLILNTVKEMTQPEVMSLLNRAAVEMQEIEEAPLGNPPSMFALLRAMREPEVRRGLARALVVMRSLGSQSPGLPAATESTR